MLAARAFHHEKPAKRPATSPAKCDLRNCWVPGKYAKMEMRQVEPASCRSRDSHICREIGDMDDAQAQAVAALLRHHRQATGLSQEELAARAGVSVRSISNLERGVPHRPRKDTL